MRTGWIYFYLLVLSGVFSFASNDINELIAMSVHVNLGQDFSDAQAPEHLRNALVFAINTDALLNQYSPNDGLPRLKEAVAKLYAKVLGREVRPANNVMITAGATEALHVAFHALTSPGDEWIIIEPAYTRYIPIVKLMEGVMKYTSLKPDPKGAKQMTGADWKLDKVELKSLFNEKTKGILLNNPNNPTGKSFTREDLEFIADLVKKWNAIVICDEAHEWVTYKTHKHLRIASFPEMFSRTITIGTASKSFSVTGWRIGWVYGPSNLLNIMKPIHANTAHSAPTPIQAIAVGLEEELENFGKEKSFFRTQVRSSEIRRDRLARTFLEVGMTPTIPDAGNCMLVNWTAYKSELSLKTKEDNTNEEENSDMGIAFNNWMTAKIGLVGVPMSLFYSNEHKLMGEDYIRYCFHKKDETIEEAVRRIRKLKPKAEMHNFHNALEIS